MTSTKNQLGLSRDIPSEIARRVRRECGFGCVVCGGSIVTYEHIDPEFKDAQEHDASCIALLCAGCHDKVTRKFWSKDKIKLARNKPKCKEIGFSREELDFGSNHPYIHFGGVKLYNCNIPIEACGIPVFSIALPEEQGAPYRLSANFTDPDGSPSFQIADNIWKLFSGAWDAECKGGKIEIRSSNGPHTLVIRTDAPNGICVERLHMRIKHLVLVGDQNTLSIHTPTGVMHFTGGLCDNCHIGFSIS